MLVKLPMTAPFSPSKLTIIKTTGTAMMTEMR